MLVIRKAPKRDWTWAYIIVFALVACASYTLEREIEINQLPLAIDYN